MPEFRLITAAEAQAKTVINKRAALIQEYVGYIEQLTRGRAGTLRPGEGESVAAVRRRFGEAAKAAAKDLVIKRVGDNVAFWETARKPGRLRKRAAG